MFSKFHLIFITTLTFIAIIINSALTAPVENPNKHKEIFNARVDTAVSIVTKQYPSAKLYEADGKALGELTRDPAKIDHMRVVFWNENQTTVIIEETSLGKFGQPTLLNEPWLEDIEIEWPIKMTLDSAHKLKEAAGFNEPYKTVTLRHILYPGIRHPLFIFGNGSSQFVFVDTVTSNVTTGK
ncbi:24195_t:CDS:2 [Racocetra persica]|uniref:24195_t:CDS:1 n=1 Tax=Racocetra persica TaxID=160502 RepID=A0ACA9LVQ6_9GLOM|nr:24195_t:CDS:2 [Racocetra persica]